MQAEAPNVTVPSINITAITPGAGLLGSTVQLKVSFAKTGTGSSGTCWYEWTIDGAKQPRQNNVNTFDYTIPAGDQNAKQVTVSCTVTGQNDTSITDTDAITFWQVKVNLAAIAFNYNTSAHTQDGLNIRENKTTEITAPEYVTGAANKPAAYIRNTSPQIAARFTVLPRDVTSLKIKATSSGCLGGLNETQVTAANGESQGSVTIGGKHYALFSASKPAPATISKNTFSWDWQVTSVNGNNLASAATFGTSGGHTVYVLYAAPAAPWSAAAGNTLNPWMNVLDYVCTWASGSQQASSGIRLITVNAYNAFGRIYRDWDTHTSLYGECDLHSLLSDNWADCKDMASVVQLFANAVGFSTIKVRRIQGAFSYKPILPIGWSSWTMGAWSHHMIAWYNNTVYDACEKLKQSAPYVPVADDLTGTYKSNLFDSGTFAPQSPVNATITQ